MKRVVTLSLTLLWGLSLAACGGTDYNRWTEEVQSYGGQIFTLEGEGARGSSGFPFAHRGPVRYVSYFHRPSGAYWRSHNVYSPAIFDIVDGAPIAIVFLEHPVSCQLFNYPENSLIAFQWSSQHGWKRRPHSPIPAGLARNVLEQVFSQRDAKRDLHGFIALDEKRARMGKTVSLTDWIARNGGNCEKARREGATSTDSSPPVLEGFHEGTPR